MHPLDYKDSVVYLEFVKDKDKHRSLLQTFLTTPEWRNVDMADEFSSFIEGNQSFVHYPFFYQTYGIWKTFILSAMQACKHNSIKEVFLSEHFFMDLFIVNFTTLSFLSKGLASLLLRPFFNRDNDTQFQKALASLVRSYADFLPKTPFYMYPYFDKIKEIRKAFQACKQTNVLDKIGYGYTLVELFLRGLLSKPLAYFYNIEANAAPLTDTLFFEVKADVEILSKNKKNTYEPLDVLLNADQPIETFKEHGIIVGKSSLHLLIDKSQKVKDSLMVISFIVSRYDAFGPAVYCIEQELKKILKDGFKVSLVNVCGQEKIQCNVISHENKETTLNRAVGENNQQRPKPLDNKEAQYLYSYSNYLEGNLSRKSLLYLLPVRNINASQTQIKALNQNPKNNALKFRIHDF